MSLDEAVEFDRATPQLAEDMWLFLLLKPAPKLVGRRCTGPYHHAEGGCKRPVWGDGKVLLGKGNIRFDLCSRCWHLDQALHGKYRTTQANPASHPLGPGGIRKLTFNELPDIGAHLPDSFPDAWANG